MNFVIIMPEHYSWSNRSKLFSTDFFFACASIWKIRSSEFEKKVIKPEPENRTKLGRIDFWFLGRKQRILFYTIHD